MSVVKKRSWWWVPLVGCILCGIMALKNGVITRDGAGAGWAIPCFVFFVLTLFTSGALDIDDAIHQHIHNIFGLTRDHEKQRDE